MIDLHVHLIGERERPATKENIRQYLEAAKARGLVEIGFSDHDLYWEDLNFPLIKETAQEYPELNVRIGLEVDYRPQDENRIDQMLKQFPFDYIIGSVHEIDGWCFDMPGQENKHKEFDSDTLYREYFALVAQAARSGLFTTLGHFDLIKIFGIRPRTDILELAEKALAAAVENELALEINTNGRYKPVGEIYPETRLVNEINRLGIALTLGSDAHIPEVVGRDLDEILASLRGNGVKQIASFKQKQKITYTF